MNKNLVFSILSLIVIVLSSASILYLNSKPDSVKSFTQNEIISNADQNAILPLPIPKIKYTTLTRSNITDVTTKVIDQLNKRNIK